MSERKRPAKKAFITAWIPKQAREHIQRLVEMGYFLNLSEALRVAIHNLLLQFGDPPRQLESFTIYPEYKCPQCGSRAYFDEYAILIFRGRCKYCGLFNKQKFYIKIGVTKTR